MDNTEDDCAEDGIPLPNVTSNILAKIVEYCKRHVEASKAADGGADKASSEDLKAFDSEFVKVDQSTFFDLILGRLTLSEIGMVEKHIYHAALNGNSIVYVLHPKED